MIYHTELHPRYRVGMTKRQVPDLIPTEAAGEPSCERYSISESPEKYHRSRDQPFFLLGVDISSFTRTTQFLVCAGGVFAFTLVYGYLQELITVNIFNRELGMFQGVAQMFGYAVWSFLFKGLGRSSHKTQVKTTQKVPIEIYIGIALLRAFDLSMTNMAMMFINYPAKTLIKSSRVVWTMGFGVIFAHKKYQFIDYFAVFLMVSGLVIFLYADASSSAVFQPMGIIMLIASLMSDGAISNLSESLMTKYGVSQDDYIFNLYSLALIVILAAAGMKGDLKSGLHFLSLPGTMEEMKTGSAPTWTIEGKFFIITVFSTFGFFGSSCSAAITKHFGAFTMSMTSTVRKATTLFLSFLLFPNKCTLKHVLGILLFMISLVMKSLNANKGSAGNRTKRRNSEKDWNNGFAYIV